MASFMFYADGKSALEKQAFAKLTAVREMKASHVEDYFQQIRRQVLTFSEDRMVIDATRNFRKAFESLDLELDLEEVLSEGDLQLKLYYQNEFLPRLNRNLSRDAVLADFWPDNETVRALQYSYIVTNPFDVGSKHQLNRSRFSTDYSDFHAIYHPVIRSYLEKFGYYDIFLVDPETGHIVYSVFKEVDFGTSLLTGPYRDTNFAQAFRAARQLGASDFVRLEDFAPYPPSYNAPASFIASPIFDGEELVGVLLFQMPVDRINEIMTSDQTWSDVGLGDSGETYLVGDDFKLRSQSRFLIEDQDGYLNAIAAQGTPAALVDQIASLGSAIGLQDVRTEGAVAALAGETGVRIFSDYRGEPVLSSYRSLGIADVNWIILSEIDESEAFQPATTLRNKILLSLVFIVVGSIVIAILFSRNITSPLRSLSERAGRLAEGDLDTEITAGGRDELSALAKDFERMRRSIKELVDRQTASIEALAVPLIPVADDVIVLPLVGELDPERMQRVRATLIEGIHEYKARCAIIDITGIPSLDSVVASALGRAASGARMLGAEIVITGMRPEIAKELADLDIRMDGVVIRRSLQSGISYAETLASRSYRPGNTQ
jgi:methyl-accepting chemotaxis protein